MHNGLYLLCLVIALAGLSVLDAKFKLAVWRDTRRALRVIALGVLFFVLWDVAGIKLHIFAVGSGNVMTSLQLLPELPVEEPLFLTLLMYQGIILWELLRRWHAR